MLKKLAHFLVRQRILLIVAVLLLAAGGTYAAVRQLYWPASRGQQIPLENGSPTTTTASNGSEPSSTEVQSTPMSIQLSSGEAQPQAVQPLLPVAGEPLSPAALADILARLPALPAQPDDQVDFKLSGEPIPPPRPGQTVEQAFPPAESLPAEVVPAGPLEVLRYAPEGEVNIAPFVNVTFNQPMVALDTLQSLSAAASPVVIDPPLPGVWRWLGTKTLTFEYDSTLIDRLPKATAYRVTVPAGTKSAAGGVLAESVTWTFTTPPAQVKYSYPTGGGQSREPLFFIEFDQRVNPAAVLETIHVLAGGSPVSLRLARQDEIDSDPQWSQMVKRAAQDRWVAFRASEPLPADAQIQVNVGPGAPSAEGPLTTTETQSYSFSTYGPLKVTGQVCGWGGDECPPFTPFIITFSNPIDETKYDPSMLRIEPDLPGVVVNVIRDTIQISGATKGQTTYTVALGKALTDIYGQTLGRDTRLTFRVTQARPTLINNGQYFITLDPALKKPVYSVYAINYSRLDAQVFAVQPSDWPAYQEYLRGYSRSDDPTPPGRKVLDRALPVEAAADTLSEVNIDLSPYMDGPSGNFIVIVRPPANLLSDKDELYWQTVQTWVQVTQIGLDAFNDSSQMVAWATDLKNGAPLSGVKITAQPGGSSVQTGADGTVRFPIPEEAVYLVAEQGANRAILPNSPYPWSDTTWRSRPVQDALAWYVFDDRQMYRPGEEVHIKGWLRKIGGQQDGDVGPLGDWQRALSYQVYDSTGNEIANGSLNAGPLDGFDFSFTIPEQINLGDAYISLSISGYPGGLQNTSYNHSFQIQEFRRPEFEVTARNETPGPYFAGESATVAVKASYYAGGALLGAPVAWQVTSTPGQYSPPNWPGFTFGVWSPWWWVSSWYDSSSSDTGPQVETFSGQTDANGEHFLRLAFDRGGKPQPVNVTAEGTVMDVNRQAWTGSTSLLVHPASLYVGLRSDKYFVERGTPIKVDVIVADLDGNPLGDRPVEVTAVRLEWKYQAQTWREEETDPQTCQVGSQSEPVTCTFQTPVGGRYRIRAVVSDPHGRQNLTELTRWVSGGQLPPARTVEQEQVTLIPDRESYQPGDVAQVLVQSPFSPAEGLLTVTRGGLLYTERFTILDGTATLSIPIKEAYIPNINIQVDLNGSAPRADDRGEPLEGVEPRPAFASGQLELKIPPTSRILNVQAELQESELAPGGSTILALALKDAEGRPVADAEMAVVVVDEAILALTHYQMSDPLSAFYPERWPDWSAVYARSSIILANPLALAEQANNQTMATQAASRDAEPLSLAEMPAAAPAAEMAKGGEAPAQPEPIRVRADFNPLAVFAPSVRTDAQGNAQVPVKLPDNLTRYRVMVVAVDAAKQFGMAETNLVARLPLMVRPAAPRFLNFGDRFELPVVIQNQTGEPLTVDVAARAANLTLLSGPDGQGPQAGVRVSVPAHDRVEVRFPAVTDRAGVARIQFAAVSGAYVDAATVELPVYTPATTEAFATYGVIDNGAIAQPVAAPSGVIPQFGGLQITTSSTALQSLTDAVLYLTAYPYECSEQLSSRILAISALRDVLTAFKADGLPSPAEMEASVDRDVQILKTIQNDDGGFSYWRRGQESFPFNTVHVTHALYRAQSKGFTVPPEMLDHALAYLRDIESHYPYWYSAYTRRTISAYALYVRNLMGDRDPNKALALLDEAGLDEFSLDAIGWLWPVLQDAPGASARLDEIRRLVNNRAVETAGAANFTTRYDEQNYLLLGSNRRTDAILLDALISDNPQHDLIPKVVNGLLAQRTRGRWGNTQENVFVLLALDHYFNAFEAQTPDFVARIWLGEDYVGSHEFQGRTTDRVETDVPMAFLVDPARGGGTQDLVLSKDGAGRLYYRLGLKYAPADLKQDALDMGFVVQRVYEALDDPQDVSQDSDGAWHIKAGARVRVRLTMAASDRRYHVALVDHLPAGLEIVNPALEVSATPPPDPESSAARMWWWWGPWYEHQNMRDERAEAFTTLLWDGVYEYTYIARATTPGAFIVPPAKAEEMYSPEVFGRSASAVVIIK